MTTLVPQFVNITIYRMSRHQSSVTSYTYIHALRSPKIITTHEECLKYLTEYNATQLALYHVTQVLRQPFGVTSYNFIFNIK